MARETDIPAPTTAISANVYVPKNVQNPFLHAKREIGERQRYLRINAAHGSYCSGRSTKTYHTIHSDGEGNSDDAISDGFTLTHMIYSRAYVHVVRGSCYAQFCK